MVGEEAHGAIFVTSGAYTPCAIEFARDKPIKLVDGRELVEMLRGVQPNRTAVIDKIPSRPSADNVTSCPRCGSAMVKRVAKQGAGIGNAFWGCSRFPGCRGTRPP